MIYLFLLQPLYKAFISFTLVYVVTFMRILKRLDFCLLFCSN